MEIPPLDSTIINWNGFLETIRQPSRAKQESCAWIFVDMKTGIWNILKVKNIGLKDMSIRHSFAPDKKDFAKIKRIAKKNKWTRIGCVHTHVVTDVTHAGLEHQMQPSEPDIKYAKKYNDIVRIIIVVGFLGKTLKGRIYGIIWFDQYGNILKRKNLWAKG